MRFVFIVCFLCFAFIPPARAQEAKSEPAAKRVVLAEDQENGALRIVIDGKEVGRFDAKGLHVEGLVTSGNSVVFPTDAIPDWNRRETGGSAP